MNNLNFVGTPSKGLYNHPFNSDNLLSGKIGQLIPIQCDEVLPRERWKEDISFLIRFAPLTYPAMVKMNVCFFSFFVPTRILTPRNSQHSTWEQFILSLSKKSKDSDGNSIIPILPSLYTSSPLEGKTYNDAKDMLKARFAQGTLSDYLDLLGAAPTPTEIDNDNKFNIPFDYRVRLDGLLAYQMVYNYWFRRDQIEPEITFPLSLGLVDLSNPSNSEYVHPDEWDSTTDDDFFNFLDQLFTLREKNYERDYFTSSLPNAQFGEDVTLGDGNLFLDWSGDGIAQVDGIFNLQTRHYSNVQVPSLLGIQSVSNSTSPSVAVTSNVGGYPMFLTPNSEGGDDVVVGSYFPREFQFDPTKAPFVNVKSLLDNELSGGYTPITINEFRLAMQLQAVKEAINRGGTMYVEVMQNVYDSLVPDARLQQPIYLGGLKCPVQIGTVVQTSESQNTPLGTLGGKAQTANGGRLFKSKKPFTEHGYVLTIACVAPRTGYVGGIPRKWMKKDPLDYYNKFFAHLGEQQVMKGELFANPWDGYNSQNQPFGYQERYNEYRHAISRAHGAMRSMPKDAWHVFRMFDQVPSLSTDFIKMRSDDFDRIFEFEDIEGTSNEHFDLVVDFNIKKKSPVPKFGTPYSFI